MNRLSLKGWSHLDDLRQKIESEVEFERWYNIPNLVFDYVTSCGVEIDDPPWFEVAELYQEAVKLNHPRINFPIFSSKEKTKKHPWEYDGRTWFFWLNLFASHYGWSADQIAALDLDEAIGLYEEIIVDEQHRKEWEWGLSERAFVYNKTTKKSNFHPLAKPDWMSKYAPEAQKPVKTIRMPVSALPVGNVVELS